MRKRLKWGAGVLVLAGALLLAACGSGTPTMSGSPATSAPSSGGSSITISNFMFTPMSLSVSPGATVKVTNKDSATHTLTATGGQFDTGDITKDQTRTFKAPSKPGTYHYICSIHQFMTGTIIVK
jgi:plastocyanin